MSNSTSDIGMNPANLRWKYLLETLRDETNSPEEKIQINSCIKTLSKFPLALHEPSHCAMLQNFNKHIISKMSAALSEHDAAEKRFNSSSQQFNEDISPIGRLNNAIDNKLNVIPEELSFLNESVADIEEKERKEKREQEFSDYQMALQLSQEDQNDILVERNDFEQNRRSDPNLGYQDEPPAVWCTSSPPRGGRNTTPALGDRLSSSQLYTNMTRVVPLSVEVTPPPNHSVNSENDETDEEDPFAPVPSKKSNKNKLVHAKKPLQFNSKPCNKVISKRVATSGSSQSHHIPSTSSSPISQPRTSFGNSSFSNSLGNSATQQITNESNSSYDSGDGEVPSSQVPAFFLQDPVFRRGMAALDASPKPKKKAKGKQIAPKPAQTSSVRNGSAPSTRTVASGSLSTNEGFQAPKISSNPHVVSSDDDDDSVPSSQLDLIIAQDPIFRRGLAAAAGLSPKTKRGQKPAKTKKQTSSEDRISENTQDENVSGSSANRSGRREYIPKVGSGGYAILLALYLEIQTQDFKGYMTKAELCRKAQPFANANLTFSQPGNYSKDSWYTGWSSVQSLIKKELVVAWSNPKKLKLSDSGLELAQKLASTRVTADSIDSVIDSFSSQTDSNSKPRGPIQTNNPRDSIKTNSNANPREKTCDNNNTKQLGRASADFSDASWLGDVSLGNQSKQKSADPVSKPANVKPPGSFVYCYYTSCGQESGDQDQAVVGFEESVAYLIKCRKTDLEQSGKLYTLVTSSLENQPDLCLAYLNESDCEDRVQIPDWYGTVRHGASVKTPPKIPQVARKKAVSPVCSRQKVSKPVEKRQLTDDDESADLSPLPEGFHLSSLPSEWNISEDDAPEPVISGFRFAENSGFVLRSGQYDVVLVVDAMEVTGGAPGGKKNRKHFTIDELESLQVNFECRKMSIGDFVWIAKERCSTGTTPRELVLPYIIERKRLDDLRSSIMDGRYKEQKSRLNLCGVKVKYYLVEEAGLSYMPATFGPSGRAIDRKTLDQAISNTCIRDGFKIRRSNSQKDTCKFLHVFTKFLNETYSGRDLRSTSVAGINHVTDWETVLLPFKDFHEHSRTDKQVSVREVFSNMLICQKMVSNAMAWAITQKYPTPAILHEAFAKCPQSEREKLLFGLPYDGGKKKIPVSVSKIIALLFTETSLK